MSTKYKIYHTRTQTKIIIIIIVVYLNIDRLLIIIIIYKINFLKNEKWADEENKNKILFIR